jgi:3-isopropylmalate/(R)-2-methylmalate dehydratase small subunit
MPMNDDSTQKESSQIVQVDGTGISVHGNDIDTDRIIPARFLKAITFDGIGEFAFQDVRMTPDGSETDHPFNDPVYRQASILLVNTNFGCGSSREHAPQALMRWGIKAIIGESFAEIFAGNCNTLGVPAVTVSETDITELMSLVEKAPETTISIDLVAGTITTPESQYRLQMPPPYLQSLVGGTWDSTALLLQNAPEIKATAAALPYVSNFA